MCVAYCWTLLISLFLEASLWTFPHICSPCSRAGFIFQQTVDLHTPLNSFNVLCCNWNVFTLLFSFVLCYFIQSPWLPGSISLQCFDFDSGSVHSCEHYMLGPLAVSTSAVSLLSPGNVHFLMGDWSLSDLSRPGLSTVCPAVWVCESL